MNKINKFFASSAVVGLVAIGAVVSGSTAASAHVVCNRNGDCWSTSQRYQYPNELGVRYYNSRYMNDSYRHRHWHDQRTWRDEHHDNDRGYYRDGLWITF
jgi:hypothetical protein